MTEDKLQWLLSASIQLHTLRNIYPGNRTSRRTRESWRTECFSRAPSSDSPLQHRKTEDRGKSNYLGARYLKTTIHCSMRVRRPLNWQVNMPSHSTSLQIATKITGLQVAHAMLIVPMFPRFARAGSIGLYLPLEWSKAQWSLVLWRAKWWLKRLFNSKSRDPRRPQNFPIMSATNSKLSTWIWTIASSSKHLRLQLKQRWTLNRKVVSIPNSELLLSI